MPSRKKSSSGEERLLALGERIREEGRRVIQPLPLPTEGDASAGEVTSTLLFEPGGHPNLTVRDIPIDQIRLGFNARRIDPESDPDWDDFLESIATHGLLQPLVVTPDPANDQGYILIAGNRRFRAVQMLDWKRVPALVKKLDETDRISVMMIENLQRKDLTPFEEAVGYEALQKQGLSVREIARAVHRSPAHVSLLLKAARNPALRSALERREITAGTAEDVSVLLESDGLTEKVPGALATALQWIQRNAPTQAALRARLRDILETGRPDKPPLPPRSYAVRVQAELQTLSRRATRLSDAELETLHASYLQAAQLVEQVLQERTPNSEPGQKPPDGLADNAELQDGMEPEDSVDAGTE